MHKAILSTRERDLLTKFLSGEPISDETFRMLKLRIKRNYPRISDDYAMLKQAMEKQLKKQASPL